MVWGMMFPPRMAQDWNRLLELELVLVFACGRDGEEKLALDL